MNEFNKKYFWHIVFVCLTIILLIIISIYKFLPSAAAEAEKNSRNTAINSFVKKWQDIYGTVDFKEQHLFQCMVYLHPQPMKYFKNFSTHKLSSEINWNHNYWMKKIFKGQFYKAVEELKPSKFYLNEGRTEPSLLLYELTFEDYIVKIVENYNLFFLTVDHKDYRSKKGISKQKVAQLLYSWINVPYCSADEVIEKFDLPDRLKEGDVFTNRSQPRIGMIRGWQDYVIGFISKENNICMMLFKAAAGRAQMGFLYDFNWLNKGLYKEDGKTLVGPPITRKEKK